MSKLFKISAVAFALLAMVTIGFKAHASWDFGTTTLKTGSSGTFVMNLQTALNTCASAGLVADGAFGAHTNAAVMSFQSAHMLVADGLVGNMTKAALNACGGVVTGGTGACPTGFVCTPTTVAVCPAGFVCTPATTTTTLSGTDGSISDINTLSQYSNEQVGEGENDVKVLGFEVKASNDGDIALKSIKLTFDSTGNSGSDHFNDYVDSVSVWQGSTKIGSADSSEFNEDSNGIYSKTITLTNSVVKADDTDQFYVSVDAVSNLDSGDISGDSWTIAINDIRFIDGSGVTTTEESAIPTDIDYDNAGDGMAIDFVTFSTSANTELKISTASDSPDAGVVIVDSTDNTDGVTLLKGQLKLEGTSDVNIDAFPVTLTTSGATDVDEVTGSLTLVLDGKEYTESVSTSTATSATVTFDNLNFDMNAGDTIDFEVKADINDIETGYFEEGDMLKADVTSTNRSAIDVENSQGDQLSDSTEKSGTAVGEYQEFRTQGIALTLVSTDTAAVTGTSANDDIGTFTIRFKVTAVGDTAYIGTTVTQGYTYTADLAGTTTTSGVSAVIVNLGGEGNSTSTTTGGNWRVEEGTSTTLELTVQRIDGTPLPSSGLWRASLTGVKWDSDDANATLPNTYSSNMDDFRTSYISLN